MFDRYSVIDMFGPFYGDNWYTPEIADGLTFRWMGPDALSTIRLPTMGARDLRLRWTLPILPQEHQVANLSLSVAGGPLTPQWGMRSGYATIWADIRLVTPASTIEASLMVPQRLRTSTDSVDDPRTLGLAVHKVEIFALDPEVLGMEARRLRDELMSREREISEVYSSTSWKISGPLRWLGANLSGRPGNHSDETPPDAGDR